MARYWVKNTASNWNNILNWSSSSGGAGGFSVPGIGDAVLFDGNGIGDCTIDINASLLSFTLDSAYSGTISQGTNDMTVGTFATLSGGRFVGGDRPITLGATTVQGRFTLSGTDFTSTSNILTVGRVSNGTAGLNFISGNFYDNSGRVRFYQGNDYHIIGDSITFYDMEIDCPNNISLFIDTPVYVRHNLYLTSGEGLGVGTSEINVYGDITSSAAFHDIGLDNRGSIRLIGNQDSTLSGDGVFPHLIVDKTDSTVTLSGNLTLNETLLVYQGTINPQTTTMTIKGTMESIIGGIPHTLYNLVIDKAPYAAQEFGIINLHDLYLYQGLGFDGSGRLNLTGDMTVGTNFGIIEGFTGGIAFVGDSTQNLIISTGRPVPNLIVDKTSGIVQAFGGPMMPGQNLTVLNGVFDLNGVDGTFNEMDINNDATCRLIGSEQVTFSGLGLNTDSGTVEFYGTGDYTSILGDKNIFHTLHFNGPGTWLAAANTPDFRIYGDLVISDGTFNTNGLDVRVGNV